MIDRGNGAGASMAVSVRVGREALLRKALLGSTALIGITLATPALAQSTNPAGGGTIIGSGTYTDDTATNGGVFVDNTQNSGVVMTGVTIDNTTGNPNGSGYKQNAASGQSVVLYTAGTNSLRSDQNGAALFLQSGGANLTWAIGQTDNASTTDLTATFGAYLVANGFINVVDFGTVSSLRNVTGINGDTGIYASAGSSVNLSLKAPTITGFATGINALSATGATVTTTGGSISTTGGGTGIRASATTAGAGVTVSSGSAITTSGSTGAGIDVSSVNANNVVTTTAGGTINGGSIGIQVNSAQAGHTNVVTVGAAIGNSTRPNSGVLFTGSGVVGATNTVNANADILTGSSGLFAIGSGWTNTDLVVNVASGVTVSTTGSSTIGAGHDVTLTNNGTVSSTNASGTAVRNSQGPSTITVINTGTITAGSYAIDAAATANVTNSGTISATTNVAIETDRGGTITNNTGGTIAGGSNATSGWAIRFNSSSFSTGQTVNNNATITGGGAGAIRLDAVTASTLNLNAGSTTTGLVKVSGTGATTTNLAGTLSGAYDASTASGIQTFALAATGSAQAITLGTGNDVFTWGGGTYTSIDGGAGADTFQVDVGASTTKTLNLASDFTNITNFDAYTLVSGRLTLSGARDGGAGWAVAGGNQTELTVTGQLTNISGNAVALLTADAMYVTATGQLSATGDVIYSAASGNNIQNAGTITSGAALASAIAIGSGTVTNSGTITYSGGVNTTQGNGILGSNNQLTVSNASTGSIIGRWDGVRAVYGIYADNYGLIRGDRFAGIEINSVGAVINNYATGRIYGASGEGAGLLIQGGNVNVSNASGGVIVGGGATGILNNGTGTLKVSNAGTIGTGSLDGSNNFVAGGNGFGIFSGGTSSIFNSGTIQSANASIYAAGTLNLTNTGTLTTLGTGSGALDGLWANATATIVNAGTISAPVYAGAVLNGGGTLTNAVGGTITGGSDATYGAAVQFRAAGTINNYGTMTGAGTTTGILGSASSAPITINLFAGSTTGGIVGGGGNDTLALYSGQVNASAVTQGYTDPVSGATGTITLQNAGTLAAAAYGTIDLGGGNDTLQLRGTGTGAQEGNFSLTTSTGAETITKLDSGTWSLSGAAVEPGINVVAGNGGASGTLIMSGTSGIGALYANGAKVQLNGGSAASGAMVHMVASNLQFAFAGNYANNIVLDVGTPLNGLPSVFENLVGGYVSLTANIYSGTGTNINGQAIAAAQSLTFSGLTNSVFNLTGTNSWTGITTIDSGVTVQGSTSSISGSSIVDNGTLIYNQSATGTVSGAISGTGQLQVIGGGLITLTGANTYTGLTSVGGVGTRLQIGNGVGSGQVAGTVSVGLGATVIFARSDNYTFANAINGAGDIQALGTLILDGAITTTGNLNFNSATGGTITLTAARSSGNATAVTLAGAGNTLRVAQSGSVAGGQYVGVRLGGVGDGVDNFGSITNTGTGGDSGYGAAIAVVATSGTSTINNGSASNSTATISGQNAGINHVGSGGVVATGALSVNNYGLISGNLYNAIENQGGSGNLGITNYATGRIVGQGNAGGGNGIGMGGAGTLTLSNAGLIIGRSNGIATGSSVNITNQNGGTIAAGTLTGGTTGTIVAGGSNGIQAVGGTVTNQAGGVIRGSFLGGTGGDTNAITSTAAMTVINSGQILGVAFGSASTVRANGVYLDGGSSSVTNNAGGLITGGWDGVYLLSGGSVTNSGNIAGNQSYGVEGASSLTNNASGRIFGATGASMRAGGVLNNSGLIASAVYDSSTNTYTAGTGTGATFTNGSLSNQYGGTITGVSGVTATGTLNMGNGGTITGTLNAGLNLAGANNGIYNGGTISGGSSSTQGYGVRFTSTSTGSLTNQTNGLISGSIGGVYSGAATGTSVDNSGTIVGTAANSRGITFQAGTGQVTNQASGTIVGQGWGISVATTGLIYNSGFIGSGTLSGGTAGTFTVNAAGNGVTMNGGTLGNNAGGTIIGGNYGVASGGSVAANISNAGTITGGNYAIYLTGTNNDTVSLFDGSITNGAIDLGAGNDTLNWYGGSFTSINANAGNDTFNAYISGQATLDASTLTGFESHLLNGGGSLTLTGTQAGTEGGWNVNSTTLALDANAAINATGSGVNLGNSSASLTIADGGKLFVVNGYTVTAFSGGSVTNDGLIRSTGAGYSAVITNGGLITNQSAGLIAADGTGVRIQAVSTTLTNDGIIVGKESGVIGNDAYQTLVNTGIIAVGDATDATTQYYQINQNYSSGYGVQFTAGGSVTNSGSGIIAGGYNGVDIAGGAATIDNSSNIIGYAGFGLQLDAAAGVTSTITNHMSGTLEGGSGAALLSGDGTINMTNEVGSYMYGSIVSVGDGVRNIDLAGTVYGDYDASIGAGVDNVILRSGGSITNVTLGAGDDTFTYFGGSISGIVDGGDGYDKLFADLGAGQSYNVSLANFANFEAVGLVSGDMTISGSSGATDIDIYAGTGTPAGTVTFTNTAALTGDIYVNGATIRTDTAGGFGSGTIHMIDPTATFGATGTYGNNISLEVVTPSSADPATLNADAGVIATLTGAITTSTNAGVDPNQELVIGGQGTIVLTNTANNWTGTTTINAGATLQGASDTISGSAILNNGTLAYQQAYTGTVSQDITGNGYVYVGGLTAGNALTFAGTNTLGGSIVITDASNVAISGATSSGSTATIDMGSGASRLDVTATGSLTSNGYAVTGSGASQSVFNLGSITSNGGDAIFMTGANVLVDNSGSVTGNRAFSTNATDAQLINRAGGTLTGNSFQAVYLGNGGTVDNSGTIQSLNAYPTIYGAAGVTTITNNAGGSISGDGTVIAVYGAGSSVTNAGSITSTADTAIYLAGGGTVTNSGSITANGSGVGVWTSAGGTFTNQSGGTITGGNAGMILDGSDLVTVNLEAGSTTDRIFSYGTGDRAITIAGTLNGGYYGNAGADAISIDTSATVTGTLDGGDGVNTLALTGTGAATLGNVANIASATKSGTGTWTLAGATDIAAWTVTGGTLATNGGAIADTASVALNGGALQLNGDEAIGILTGTGTADLGTSVLALTNGTGSFTGTLNGTTGSLLIDGANLSFGGTANYTGLTEVRSGSLALTPGATFNSASTLLVGTAGTLDLGTTSVGVGAAGIDGTLNGTGTLTANTIALNGATVNGNLAGGLLTQVSGISTLAGTATMNVLVGGGTLLLAGNDRIGDTATLQLDSGATLDLQAFNDTVGIAVLQGTLAGTGTLTASQYQLTGATVNANLGAGMLINLAGVSTLNGTAAGDVSVQGGTLTLGAPNRLADTATVSVSSGATLNLGAFNDTIGALGLNGTLAGTGTLTASQYQLNDAVVNANLGAGTLVNLGGSSALNGTAAGNVSVQAGTLTLGASNRLADTATVVVSTGATLNLGANSDTVGALSLNGTLAGTGTLTAAEYQLTGATVNAKLGAGTLFNLGGTSTLNGTAAGDVSVQAGTLTLGAANRLADTATVVVSTGAVLNLGANSDTVGALGLNGTLAGTGTLTAAQYQLTGATVNANLGAGTLVNLGGTSALSGTAAATTVTVQAGTLRLGASDRLADTAVLGVASGATFDLANYNETVTSLAGTGTVALGTGRLTLSSASNTGFAGALTGAGVLEKQGIGTLTLAGAFANTGRIDVTAGTLAFSGSTQGGIRVQGGTLIGSGTTAGTLTIASGSFSPGGLATGQFGAVNPIGNWTVGSLVATGGSLLFDFGGASLNFASDSIKVNGTATLSGGTVAVNALTAAASDYRFNQLYTIVQASSLTGTFANGSVFATVASNPNLKWRLRYDLVANAVVLQVQKNMEFNDGVAAGDTNTLAVANALSNSTTGNASDQWANTLNAITSLSTAERVAAFKSFSGEILANVSTATISANNLFTDLLRQRVGDGSDALIGGGFTGSSLADVRSTSTAGNSFASALSGATLPGASESGTGGNGAIWGQVYGGYQKLLGDTVHAGVENTTAGVAMGVETRFDGFTAGIAGGVAQIDSDMNSRNATVSGNQYQLGGYMSYDMGGAFVAASGSWYSSDLDSKRTLSIGGTTALATGDIHAEGYSVGVTAGFRTELGNGLRLALIGSASKVRDQRDGFDENAAGGLGLQVASAKRDLFTASGELRLGATVKTGAGTAMPWVSMGVRYNSGDLDTLGNMRFSGAPAGTGSFGVEGVRIAPVLGTLGVGIDARASKNVRLGVSLEGSAGENTREGRASVRVKIGF